jgi:hypothetical protein
MRTIDSTVLTTLMEARSFIDGHLPELGTIESAGYRQKLIDTIDALEQHAVDQATADRMGDAQLAREHALTAALRINHMRPIAAIAAARLRDVPEFTVFQMPPQRIRTTELAIAAETMAKVARPYTSVFVDAGLAEDFTEQLEAAAESLRQCFIDRQTTATKRSAATAGLRLEASRGRKVLRVLSSLIEPRLKNDEALLAAWHSARHIRRPDRPQPVVHPLLTLVPTQTSVSGLPPASAGAPADAPADAITTAPNELALPAAPIPDAFVSPEAAPRSSTFSRVAQIVGNDSEPGAPAE